MPLSRILRRHSAPALFVLLISSGFFPKLGAQPAGALRAAQGGGV
jgi:hypothetical protein